jgi:WD40 repeat protein
MGQCVVWDLATFRETITAKSLEAEALYFLTTAPDGSAQALLVKKGDGTAVVIRDPPGRKQRVLLEVPPEKGLSLAFSRDGKKLLVKDRVLSVASGPPQAQLWDLTSDNLIMKLQTGKDKKDREYFNPRLSADGLLLVGQGVSGRVRIWDVGKEKSRLDINVPRPSNLPFPVIAPDARTVFAGDALWDAASGKISARIDHEPPKAE